MSKKATGIVSYLSLIGWIIAFCAGDKEGAKFHLNQSLVLLLANLAVSVLSGIISAVFGGSIIGAIFSLLFAVVNIFLFVCWILGLVAACKEEEKEIPLLGSIKILK